MFYPIYIDPVPGLGFTGGPEFSTDIKSTQGGREKRNAEWMNCRHKYTCPFLNITNDAYLAIKKVFLICKGRNHTFLHRDYADFEANNEQFGLGDGVTKVFQLRKVSTQGGGSYERVITKPVAGAVIRVDGAVTPAVVDTLTGTVTFSTAPIAGTILRWTGEFDVQVRFDIDYLPFSLDDCNNDGYVTNGSVDLIEVVDE